MRFNNSPSLCLLVFSSLFALVACPGNAPQLDPSLETGGGTGLGGAGGTSNGGGQPGICGDDTQTDGEACDDGNLDDGDGCRHDCTIEACDDDVVDANMICFAPPVSYSASATARPAIAALNGDDDLDLVIAGADLQVRLATAAGVFGGAVTLAQTQTQAVFAHLNADTTPDLAVNQNLTAGVYLNNGMGGFSGLVVGDALMTAAAIAVGDLNGDGNDDLCVTGCANGCASNVSSLEIQLSNGDGTFATAVSYAASASAQTRVADIDRDQRLDVVALNFNNGGSIGVFLGDGGGAVGAQIESPVPDNCSLNHMDLGDVDGDDLLDVVVSSGCGAKPVHVLFGAGDGTFTSPVSLDTEAGGTVSARFVDLDNDGALDVVSGTLGPLVVFFKGDGAGAFGSRTEIANAAGGGAELASADLNRDGASDLIVASGGALQVYLSNP